MTKRDAIAADQTHANLGAPCPAALILGSNVTRLRKQAKITKQKFSLMMGIGRPFLNRIENGTADPRLSLILGLAAALETTPEDLLHDYSPSAGTSSHTSGSTLDPLSHHARLG